MAFGTWYVTWLGGVFFFEIHYYVPIWSQAIRGAAATQFDIRNLLMILNLVFWRDCPRLLQALHHCIIRIHGYWCWSDAELEYPYRLRKPSSPTNTRLTSQSSHCLVRLKHRHSSRLPFNGRCLYAGQVRIISSLCLSRDSHFIPTFKHRNHLKLYH